MAELSAHRANQAARKSDEYHGVVRDLSPHLFDVRSVIHADTQNLVRIRDRRRETKFGGIEFSTACILL